jgi:pyruvate dehydrogenase E2 component (dihydrolipoamide acetyltransferase)
MSDIRTLEMPKWGLSMEEGLLARWAIQEGDLSPKGRKSVKLRPAKSSMFWRPPSPVRYGIIARVGDTLPVGAVLALVADASVSDAELDAFAASLAAAQPAAPVTQTAEPAVAAVAPSVVPPPPISLRHPLGRPRYPPACKA